MGELYCCSNRQRTKFFDEENNELVGKNNFLKKYIIGVGGFSKVSIFKIIKIYQFYRFGKSNIKKIIIFMQ